MHEVYVMFPGEVLRVETIVRHFRTPKRHCHYSDDRLFILPLTHVKDAIIPHEEVELLVNHVAFTV